MFRYTHRLREYPRFTTSSNGKFLRSLKDENFNIKIIEVFK